jgi:predicted O-methyltransferase YrrM
VKPEDVRQIVGDLPYMQLEQGRFFYNLIVTHKLSRCLELGFFHGVSSLYIGGAIQDTGGGSLLTIDLTSARNRSPNIETLIRRARLEDVITPVYEPTSYNWSLMKLLERGLQETFDFCYIDGGHTWYSTGFAYCLVSRLLRKGGWVAFDDINYSYDKSSMSSLPMVRRMPEEERRTAQVRKVFELLTMQDPFWSDVEIKGRLGLARKTLSFRDLQREANA